MSCRWLNFREIKLVMVQKLLYSQFGYEFDDFYDEAPPSAHARAGTS